jgi:meso-butanediol dehydrogenase/(S,S)-butanediol dehydrogenase/diacetyl reductase
VGRLQGRAAIITGGARGIGLATARLFLREGARVGLLDQDEAALRQAAAELGADGVLWQAANIADAGQVNAAIEQVAAGFGGLDILVNNAAARAFGPVSDATPEAWEAILQVNVIGLSNCARAALPHLRKAGRGAIVNVSSVFAIAGRANMGLYDATKAAALALTRVLACEEAPHGIRVNAVCPSSTLTPWTVGRAGARGMSVEELKQKGAAPCLLGRWAEAEEVAYPILWLASDEASFITGITLPVDGGLSAV